MEYFDLVDEQNQPLHKSKPRKEVHKDGDWHRAISCWIINDSNELLIQRRSPEKESYPDLWDTSFAGHISAGEDSLGTVLREGLEELGLEIAEEEIHFLGTVSESYTTNNGNFVNNEFKDIYVIQRNIDLNSLSLQEEEVSEVAFIEWQKLMNDLKENPAKYAPHQTEYDLLFSYLSKSTL